MLFTKKIKKTPVANGFTRTTFADKKIKLASWLSHKTKGYSPLQKKIGLFIFCMLVGGAGILSILTYKSLNVPDIIVPRYFVSTPFPDPRRNVPVIVFNKDFKRLETLRNFLDSLRKYDTIRLKQILTGQPDILKNISLLESIYQSQKK